MSQKFTQAFKIQAVEKALSRTGGVSVIEISESLGIGYSTLQKWIVKSKNHEFEPIQPMTKEKRPQDWSNEERLNMVIECNSLSEEEISELCRTQGLYPHHINRHSAHLMKDFIINSKTANFLSKFCEFSLIFTVIVGNGCKKISNAKIFSSKPNILPLSFYIKSIS